MTQWVKCWQCKHKDLSLNLMEKPSIISYTYNTRTENAEAGGSLELTGQLV